MIKIEVKDSATRVVSGNSKKTGKSYEFHKQDAFAHLPGEPYPVRMEFSHESAKDALAPGMYLLTPESFYVDRYGKLTLGRLKVVPVAKAA